MARKRRTQARKSTARQSMRAKFQGTGKFKKKETAAQRAFRQARERQTTQRIKKRRT